MTPLYRSLLLGIFTLLTYQSHAQFGLNVLYQNSATASAWDEVIQGDDHLSGTGIGISLDYWFRLKNYRVEFLVEGGYLSSSPQDVQLINNAALGNVEASWNAYHLLGNTNIYVFDLEGDCNCPTFGKDGGLFKKGFHLQLGIGLNYLNSELVVDDENVTGASLAPTIHGGLGLDIGAGEYLTITPWVRYTYRFDTDWEGISNNGEFIGEEGSLTSTSTYLTAGIRLGYRWDYKRRY